jgi:hypothetical protein
VGPNVDCALQELECVLDEYRRGEVVSPQLIVPEHCIAKSPTARRRKFAFATAAAVGTLCLAGVFYAAAQEETSPAGTKPDARSDRLMISVLR